MYRDYRRAPVGMAQEVMAPANPHDMESSPLQGGNELLAS